MYAQAIQEDSTNRKQISMPNYKVKDFVFIATKNFCSE